MINRIPFPGIIGLVVFLVFSVGCSGGRESEFDVGPTYAPANWSSYGFDQANSLHNCKEREIGIDNVVSLEIKWRIDGLGGVTGTPTVVDGTVYFGDWNGWLRAVEADTGEVIWEKQVTEDVLSASVLIANNHVYVPDLAGVLHARDRFTGEETWSKLLDDVPSVGIFSSPVLVEDILIIGVAEEGTDRSFRGSVVALDAKTGVERWRVYTTSADETAGFGVSVWSSAAVDQDRKLIFIGTGNSERPPDSRLANAILAIDYETGEVAWVHRFLEEDAGKDLDVGASPNLFSVSGRDVVGVGGKSGEFRVVDRETGSLIWEATLTRGTWMGGVMAAAAIGDGVLFVTSNSPFEGSGSVIFALDASDGSVLWEHALQDITFGAPALANEVFYLTTVGMLGDAELIALDAGNGETLWADNVDGLMGGGISISDGMLYVGYGFGFGFRPAEKGGIIAYSLP